MVDLLAKGAIMRMNSATLGLELQVLRMYFDNGMKEKAIAKSMNVSLSVVQKIVAEFKSIKGKK